MKNIQSLAIGLGVGAVMSGGLLAFAQNKPEQPKNYERNVKEGDVPKAALETLKKLAAGAAFTEFAEEVEHGHKFYEGSWKGPHGNIDGLVTEAGEATLRPGDCAGFKSNDSDGHCFQNRSDRNAKLLVIGSRDDADACEYPDIDMQLPSGRYSAGPSFRRKDGTPY